MVSAHAVLVRVTPSASQTLARAPESVQLLFSEPIDPNFSSVRVLDAAGQAVDNADGHVDPNNDRLLVASLRPDLPNGVYTVAWRNLSSIDVHPDEGRYRLFVGVPVVAQAAALSPASQLSASPETTLGRWWFYVAASLFGGVLAAWKFIVSPALGNDYAGLRATLRRRLSAAIIVGSILLILGTLFSALAQAAAAADVPLLEAAGKPLSDLLLRGRFAAIWWPRMGLEVASVLLILFGGIDGLASESALATLPAVLLTSALTSHGAALPQGVATGVVIDWLHIVGATAWVGGLVALLLALAGVRSADPSNAVLRRLIGRFGRFALVAALLVVLSGGLQGALEVGSWASLFGSLYGQLILIKIGLLAAMLVLAVFNEWRARSTASPAAPQSGAIRAGVRVEFALGVIVFAVAAMLSGTSPPPNG